VALFKEATREIWGWTSVEILIQDVRYALRMMRRSPGFTAVAVLSLALGIGANTAIFTMIDAIFLKLLPVKDPQELVQIDVGNGKENAGGVPYELFRQGRNGNGFFSGMLTSGADGLSFTADGRTERVMGEADSGNLFAVLGVDAAVGRTFSQEIVNGAWGPEAVLSYDFWERRFGGDAGIVGKTIQLNGYPFTVVGISSRGFFGTSVGFSPEIRFPKLPDSLAGTMPAMHLLDPIDYDDPFVGVMARLRPGVTAQQAQAATEVMYQQYVAAHPEITKRVRYRTAHVLLLPGARGGSWMRDEFGRPFFLLMVVVGTVLLIACANIASLLIARSMARRPEIAVRLAIGAGRARLFRQLLTETVLLSVLGGALGIAFAYSLNEFLFGFLLTVPFTDRFARMGLIEHGAYFGCFLATTIACALLMAPSVYHRLHWRRDVVDKEEMMRTSNRLAISGISRSFEPDRTFRSLAPWRHYTDSPARRRGALLSFSPC
jgi:predicted permease